MEQGLALPISCGLAKRLRLLILLETQGPPKGNFPVGRRVNFGPRRELDDVSGREISKVGQRHAVGVRVGETQRLLEAKRGHAFRCCVVDDLRRCRKVFLNQGHPDETPRRNLDTVPGKSRLGRHRAAARCVYDDQAGPRRTLKA